jgi:hypothetical protein
MSDAREPRRDARRVRSGRVRIRWPDDLADDDTSEEQKRRAAVVVDALLRRHVEAGRELSKDALLAETTYGAALVSPQAQRRLGDLSKAAVLHVHGYACILTELRGHTLSAGQETELLIWLCEQAGLDVDEALTSEMARQRRRRHALLSQRETEA